ncbi:serine hydrolase [Aliikangiella sp. IMCC44359]|uniref:serine hydrolase n=1 Tax=Aliikangiella sp. IMCC44359 TaxID=3459125 RepID=UPI00403ACE30
MSELEIDKLVNQARKDFNVPGIAVAIVKGNKTLLAKGYGLRNIKKNKKVTADTLFQIASNSKSMTAASLALLVDEGKLDWNDKVIDYLPEFQLYDPYVTREFTIIDLLTHRSGLPLGAGDLLLFPDSENTSLKDVFKALATIKPVSSFRSEYAYDNLMYLLAGEIAARVSGMSWTNFVEKRLFEPLGMKHCRGAHTKVSKRANQATPYVYVNGNYSPYPYESHELTAPAGGVNCSINDMVKWLKMQLAYGKLPNGNPLISLTNHQEMWSPKTIIGNRFEQKPNSPINIRHYALGWTIYESMKHQIIAHTGALGGMLTSMLLVPEKEIGILVFTNQQNGYARNAIISQILQGLLKSKAKRSYQDYVNLSHKKSTDAEEKMQAIWNSRNIKAQHSLPLKSYAQTYVDEWYGKISIQLLNDKLYFNSERSPGLTGKIKHFQYNAFIVEWDNRSLFADAYLIFNIDENGRITQLKMKAFDPRTDFSFDFHHLNFKPIQK